MRLTDGKKIVDVQIRARSIFQGVVDVSIEFFEVFELWYDYTANAFFVEELDRFIENIRESIQEYEDERGCSTLPCMEMTVIECD